MIRRFNYTQRRRIEQRRINIELSETDDDTPMSFSAELDLSGMGLPSDALVVVIANRDRSAMRFNWGTVADSTPPQDCSLTEIPSNPIFRVMVLASDGSGRLLALADRIKPKRGSGQESLLWLQEEDLGKEVWRLDFADGNPTMLVNRNIPGISAAVREDEAFRSLVIPEALRAILTRALIVEEYDIDDDEGSWSEWIGFVQNFYDEEFPSISDDEDATEKTEWIEGAVEAFTEKRFHASDQYATMRRQ